MINNPNKKYNMPNNSILKYYSNINNPNNENFHSELIRYNTINTQQKQNILIPPVDLDKNKNESNLIKQNQEIVYT